MFKQKPQTQNIQTSEDGESKMDFEGKRAEVGRKNRRRKGGNLKCFTKQWKKQEDHEKIIWSKNPKFDDCFAKYSSTLFYGFPNATINFNLIPIF